MLNHIFLMGRLVSDPEMKQTQSGVDYCKFTLAVDRDYKNGDEKVADFFDVTAWRGTAKFVSQYFSKGRAAVVSGQMESHKYQDKDGNNRTSWGVTAQNIYFADSKRDSEEQNGTATSGTGSAFKDLEEQDGDLPF